MNNAEKDNNQWKLNESSDFDNRLVTNTNETKKINLEEMINQDGKFAEAYEQLKRLSGGRGKIRDNELIDAFEIQRKKYLLWKENRQDVKNIYFILNNCPPKRISQQTVPFADECAFYDLPEGASLQFWYCDEFGEKEFLLYEFTVKAYKYKAEVESLTDSFSIGINVLCRQENNFTVRVYSGLPEDVRNNVRRQLKADFDYFHGYEQPRVQSAFSFLGKSAALSAHLMVNRTLMQAYRGVQMLGQARIGLPLMKRAVATVGVAAVLTVSAGIMLSGIYDAQRIPEIQEVKDDTSVTVLPAILSDYATGYNFPPEGAAKLASSKSPKDKSKPPAPVKSRISEQDGILAGCAAEQITADPFRRNVQAGQTVKQEKQLPGSGNGKPKSQALPDESIDCGGD